MAVLGNIRTRVKLILGPNSKATNFEIDAVIVEAIKLVQNQVVNDVLKDQLTYKEYAMAGASTIAAPTNMLRPMALWAEESDGNYGYPWEYVNIASLQRIKFMEDDQYQDATASRLYAQGSTVEGAAHAENGFVLYPTPVSGRTVRLEYILKASETSTMTLPIELQNLMVYYVVSIVGMHQAETAQLAGQYISLYSSELNRINNEYLNRYGLSPARLGKIRNTYFG